MSEETKKVVKTVKQFMETVKIGSEELGEKSVKIDKELSTKIQKVKESAAEVVKHIEKKIG